MSAYSAFLERVAMPAVGWAVGMPVARYVRELEASQWWSPEDLRALQWRKFKRLLDHAYRRVPYYRRRMDEAGVTPDDIRTWEDLARVPISTKEDLRAAFPHGTLAAGVDRRRLLLYRSSGSTGEPFVYYLTRGEKAIRWAIVFRYWRWAGLRPGVPYVNLSLHAPGAFQHRGPLGQLEARALRLLQLPVFELWSRGLPRYIEELRTFRPWFVRGYPSSIYPLAQYLVERSEQLPLKGVLTFGETLLPHHRRLMEQAFACPVYDAYGGEALEVAAQCGHHPGYHINAEAVLVEVVDAEGNPLPPGERGQLVLTNLDNCAMPFIRYNIQDVGVLSEERCPCGRGLPLLESVEGRLVDTFVTPEGKILLANCFSELLDWVAGIRQYQVVQETPSKICIKVAVEEGFQEGHLQRALEDLRQYVGPGVELTVEVVDQIPLTRTGKRRWVISHLPPEVVAKALGAGTSPHPPTSSLRERKGER
jgi:phenylacetate-CoA ligase